jgi:flagellar basal-body rod protein FlgB
LCCQGKDEHIDGIRNTGHLPVGPSPADERLWENAVRLYGKRLEIVASNIANADTPNYKARDFDFKTALAQSMSASVEAKPAASPGKPLPEAKSPPLLYRVPTQSGVDGNTVDMDVERAAFTDAAIRYEFTMQKAVSEYKDILELFRNLSR